MNTFDLSKAHGAASPSRWRAAALAAALLVAGCGPSMESERASDSSAGEPGAPAGETAPAAPENPVDPAVHPAPGPLREHRERMQAMMATPRQPLAAVVAEPLAWYDDALSPAPPVADPAVGWPETAVDRENYATLDDHPVRLVAEYPVSTFSVDVDTGAYANVRRFLNGGLLPPADAVRTEELINYFGYAYPTPADPAQPFSIHTEIAPAPWNDAAHLLAVGIRGYEVADEDRPAANLVFLIDVSGSMQSPDKLPLLRNGFRLLTQRLDEDDRVAIVVYAGASGLVLEPTPGDEVFKITAALDRLAAGGSTNGGDGIRLAYAVAAEQFIPGAINRVVLATDGDFNVGTVSHEALLDLVERNRARGIALTTLGFGRGNYNDHLLEQLADHGNGNYAYIDTLNEARKVLVEELTGTLQTIASDVKIQVEFNPATVAEYRLIGYENRALRREDFANDRVDAGEIGAGHTVTALYELKLVGSGDRLIEPLRYGRRQAEGAAPERAGELAHLRLRYKPPGGGASRLVERALRAADGVALDEASDDFRFAAAVAAFGQSLRGGRYLGGYTLADVETLARQARGADPHGYRGEFVSLVALAATLMPAQPPAVPTAASR